MEQSAGNLIQVGGVFELEGKVETTTTRMLGRSGIAVSALGFGCWAIGGPAWSGETPLGWGEVDDQVSIRAIQRAVDLGITFFDTGDVYGAGHSERVLGQALAGRRDQVVIATKFGMRFDEETRRLGDACATPEFIRESCERSLKRLKTDVIDLYQFHLFWYPAEEVGPVIQTLEGLVQEGKIRGYGWSTDDPLRARVFARGAHCSAVQFRLNLLDDNPGMVALCKQFALAGINNSPLAMGLLSGKYSPGSRLGADDVRGIKAPDWMKYFKEGRANPQWAKKVDAITEILTSGGRSMAQGALAWLWARSPWMIPIPGIRTVKQAEENARALQFGPLRPEEMREIEGLILRTEYKHLAGLVRLARLMLRRRRLQHVFTPGK